MDPLIRGELITVNMDGQYDCKACWRGQTYTVRHLSLPPIKDTIPD